MKQVHRNKKRAHPSVALVQEKLARQCGLVLRTGGADGVRGEADGGAIRGVETRDGGITEGGRGPNFESLNGSVEQSGPSILS